MRIASILEDPSRRRQNGGGHIASVLYVLPAAAPDIAITANGPAVAHSSDFSLVSASKPATAGEVLSLFATGLGPTVASLNPGEPFPSSPLAAFNSPITVTVNGESAEVLGAVGYPGSVGGYQVNFRVPSDASKGMASIQVTSAWISGTPVSMQFNSEGASAEAAETAAASAAPARLTAFRPQEAITTGSRSFSFSRREACGGRGSTRSLF